MSTVSQDKADDHGITERAAEWLGVLETAGPQERSAFAAWLKTSPRHVEEFLLVTALNREFTGFHPTEDRDEIQSAILPFDATSLPGVRPAPPAIARTRHRSRWMGLAAAVMVTALTGAWLFTGPFGWRTYATAVGEHRAFELADGSFVHLNTQSKVRVRLSATARDIRLVAGEALFKVAADPARAFTVEAGAVRLRVLGTQFNVYRRTRDTRISVIDGKVLAASDKLADSKVLEPGEDLRLGADGALISREHIDTTTIAAWRQRRLIFQTERLEDIAAEFNRYHDAPRIRIEDKEVRERRLTGVFDADDPQSLVQFLTKDSDLTYLRRGEDIVIRGAVIAGERTRR